MRKLILAAVMAASLFVAVQGASAKSAADDASIANGGHNEPPVGIRNGGHNEPPTGGIMNGGHNEPPVGGIR
jgi:hypothetical protein